MTLEQFDLWYRVRYRNTSSALIGTLIIVFDFLGVMISFGSGFFLVNLYDLSIINFKSFVTYWPYIPLFIVLFWLFRLYPGIALAPAEELRHLATASFIAHSGIIISRYIEDREYDSISVAFIASCLLSIFILAFSRSVARMVLKKTPIHGIPAVLYGSGQMVRELADQLIDASELSYVPVILLDSENNGSGEYRGIPVMDDLSLGPELVKRYNIKMAIVAGASFSRDELTRLLNFSVTAFRYNLLIPDFASTTNIWMSIRDFDGLLGFATSHKLRMGWNLAFKRAVDIVAVIAGGIIVLPFLLAVALIIKLGSRGPVLYRHSRIGQNGKELKVYKFRSMVMNADAVLKEMLEKDPELRKEWEVSFKLKNDPRITPVGRWLRRTSIDEFPQIINVLKGEMSLVGPRPVTAKEIEKYGEHFQRIFSAKPGMTGLWQVSGRSEMDYNERIAYDSYYLQNWSVWLDLWVLYKTFGAVIRGKGAY